MKKWRKNGEKMVIFAPFLTFFIFYAEKTFFARFYCLRFFYFTLFSDSLKDFVQTPLKLDFHILHPPPHTPCRTHTRHPQIYQKIRVLKRIKMHVLDFLKSHKNMFFWIF